MLSAGVEVGKVAPSSTGNEYFLSDAVGALQHRYSLAALTGFDGTHEPGGARAENNHIKIRSL